MAFNRGGDMRATTSNGRRLVLGRAVAFVASAFLLAFNAAAQAGPGSPDAWYYPLPNADAAERGDFGELKDKRRVYVSFFHGSATAAARRNLEQQVLRQLRRYEGVELVDSPGAAELALHVSVNRVYAPANARASVTSGAGARTPAVRNDVAFYVLTRGAERVAGDYGPRVIVARKLLGVEDGTPFVAQEVGSFVGRLRRLRGEK